MNDIINEEMLAFTSKASEVTDASASASMDIDSNDQISWVRTWLVEHDVPTNGEEHLNDAGITFFPVECPNNTNHKEVAIMVLPNGPIVYKCFHDSCSGFTWREFRLKYEPDAYSHGEDTLPHPLPANLDNADDESSEAVNAIPWPEQPHVAAFYGLAGEVANGFDPYTEADKAATLISFLVAFGNVINRSAFFIVSGTHHYTNLFVGLVGRTAGGRKGTSWGLIRALFEAVDQTWAVNRTANGLSSGEGLVYQVRDAVYGVDKKGLEFLKDAGEPDKRLLIIESELARALQVMKREGNTLSAVLREAWDGPAVLRSLTKNDNTRASLPHISIIGHITREELRRDMEENSYTNGLANRFMWVCVRRSKLLPEGSNAYTAIISSLAVKLLRVMEWAMAEPHFIDFSDEARNEWRRVYPILSREKPGIFGFVTARAEAQVRRLAVLYAALDCSETIELSHLQAALALFSYCEQSAAYIFGSEVQVDDPFEIRILEYLREHGACTQTEMTNIVFKKKPSKRTRDALESLSARGVIGCRKVKTTRAVKATTIWYIVESESSDSPPQQNTNENTEVRNSANIAAPDIESSEGESSKEFSELETPDSWFEEFLALTRTK